jgi:cyclohexa-1,5-dienecarbonyl-CoA hydratase
MSDDLRIERRDRVATVVIDRPPLNILDLAALDRLGHLMQDLPKDDLQLLLLRSASGRAFSAGVAVEDHTPDKIDRMLSSFHDVLERLRQLPCLTLAAVRGHCLGGGLELAAACDFIAAADDSRLGQPEVQLGCYPPYAAALYPSRIGYARTLELLVTGRILKPDEAKQIGLVTWIVPAESFDEEIESLTVDLTAHSAAVCRLIKQAVRTSQESSWPQALAESERIYLEELTQSDDMREGLDAFLEKRKPEWRHR